VLTAALLAALLPALTGLLTTLLLLTGLLAAALLLALLATTLLLLARPLTGILVLVHSISFQRLARRLFFDAPLARYKRQRSATAFVPPLPRREPAGNRDRPREFLLHRNEHGRAAVMGRYLLLWLLGIPLPILLLIWIFGGLH
jgi:small-conductance mechanosensitive channel